MQSYDSKQQQHYYHKFSWGTILGVNQTPITVSPLGHATDMSLLWKLCSGYAYICNLTVTHELKPHRPVHNA